MDLDTTITNEIESQITDLGDLTGAKGDPGDDGISIRGEKGDPGVDGEDGDDRLALVTRDSYKLTGSLEITSILKIPSFVDVGKYLSTMSSTIQSNTSTIQANTSAIQANYNASVANYNATQANKNSVSSKVASVSWFEYLDRSRSAAGCNELRIKEDNVILNLAGNKRIDSWQKLGTGGDYDGVLGRINGQLYTSVDDLFRIRDNSTSTAENKKFEFNTNTGSAGADVNWNSNNFDFAEMWEWEDGGDESDDRVGYTVSLVGDKIKICEVGETPIGVISATASFLGNAGEIKWSGSKSTDEWGRPLKEHVIIDGETRLKTAQNPDYDDTIEYIPRTQRKEWGTVGLLGQCYMRPNQITDSRWIKMKKCDDTRDFWFIR